MGLFAAIQRGVALVREELFWRYWVITRGTRSAMPLDPLLAENLPFPEHLQEYVESLGKNSVRVLDVGSGPITHIGRTHPTLKIEVVPTDFLADRYNRIFASHKITPPVKTIFADAENLRSQFPENSFDLVVANNSLDHCASPVKAVEEMICVASSGSTVFLRHRENEAVRAKYQGLHQWNFSQKNGHPTLWNKEHEIDLQERFGDRVEITMIPDDEHIVIAMKKR